MEPSISRLPLIKRARGYRLYDFHGRRFLDCHQHGGHALLGHKPILLARELKQVMEKGLLADLPSVYERRLVKTISKMFPDYHTFLFASSREQLLAHASEYLGKKIGIDDIRNSLIENPTTDAKVSVWRPFSSANEATELIIPVIPFALGSAPAVLCGKNRFAPASYESLSPLLLSGAHRALTLLEKTQLPDWYSPALLADSPYFIQRDIYLIPRCSADRYDRLFRMFLEHGVFLSPHPAEPSILPLELSPGELKNLLDLFHKKLQGENDE